MSEFIGTKLTMNLGERSYDIIIKSGSLENLYQFARLDRRVAVVTDSGVPAQYAQMVADQCKDARIITVPQGEASKSFKILESVLRQMLDFGMVEGKSQKIKCFRLTFPSCSTILLCKSPKFNQSAFTTFQLQSKLFHSLL